MISFSEQDIFLVTGASSGIGKATALLFNRLGARVIACGRDNARLEKLISSAVYPNNIFIESIDFTDNIENLSVWLKDIVKKYGKLKGLVCSAGFYKVNPLLSVVGDSIDAMFNIHYKVPVLLAKAFADKRVNQGQGSSIVFISSTGSFSGSKGMLEYAGAKSAITYSAKSIANELFSRGIRVNSVSPGFIDTPLVDKYFDGVGNVNSSKDSHLIGKPEDVANLIVFLSSPLALWINGENIVIDGGASLDGI